MQNRVKDARMTRLNVPECPVGTYRCHGGRLAQVGAQTSWVRAGTPHAHLYTVYVMCESGGDKEKRLLLTPYIPENKGRNRMDGITRSREDGRQ